MGLCPQKDKVMLLLYGDCSRVVFQFTRWSMTLSMVTRMGCMVDKKKHFVI